jgi:hypothetical protein
MHYNYYMNFRNYRKLAFIVLALLSLFIPSFISKNPFIISGLLILVTIGMFYLKLELQILKIYILAFFLGPLAEIIAIHQGLWIYGAPAFFGIPLWLPLEWGIATLFILGLYTSKTA